MDEVMIAAYERKIRELEAQVDRLDEEVAGHEVRGDQRQQQLTQEIRYLKSWEGLLSIIDMHYPPDVFDGSSGDHGPRVLTLVRVIDKLRTPCQCDPPGSGELCNRCCRVRARMLAQLEPPDRARAMIAFDNSVAEEIALWQAHEAS